MGEERPGGEATEPPSEKRLRDARRRGEVPKSREVVSVAVFLAAVGTLAWTWPEMLGRLRDAMASGIQSATVVGVSPTAALEQGLHTAALVAGPVLLVAFAAALVANLAQVGPLATLQPLKPSLKRLDPIKNAKNIFGRKALFELLKSLVKVVGIAYLAGDALYQRLPAVVAMVGQPPEQTLLVLADAVFAVAVRALLLMAVLAAADLLHQRHAHRKKLMMTKVEVRREQKEAEGDPQRKSERQRIHREILDHQMLENVAQADCVIINPDHIAVALRYAEEEMPAPRVVASGHRLVAEKIKQIAKQRGIPIIRNVPLARALVDLELDEEVPAELYEAVAEVLRFVYRLDHRGD